ncbi:MAG: protein kinase, partial [Acidimicrobiia bacterium]|nr:protein kinase [Acidimicrobiia bacterium]NNL27293.1 protein kinase [Acidimicrobiia bacterium]
MDFRVLGPVVAFHEARELKLGGPKQRLVLAMLLAAHGKSVSTGVLIDGLWGEDSPSTARKMLQGYIHYLRGEVGDALVTDPGGYSLHVGADQVDERRFEGAVLEAERLIPVDPVEASERLAEALALWRGNPYADLDGEMVLQPELTRLGELRLVALSDRIDADLAIGRHEMLIGELESLAVEYPLREKFRAQLMLALYRSGRQGEALRVFAHTRDSFIEQMGIEPSDELADLEDRMLRRDPLLEIAPQEGAGSARALRGYELRETVSVDAAGTLYRAFQRSVGREVAIRVMEGARANDPAFIARFQSDTARVAKLNHPNIVYVQDVWREPGRVYEVTQWIEGERLDSYLASNRAGQTTAMRWIEQIGGALATAHRVGVVHGDVSGRNVLVSETGDVFLTDFMIGAPPSDESDDRRRFISIAHHLMFGAPPVISDRGFEALPSSATPPGLARVFEEALSVEDFLPVQQFVRNVKRAVGNDVVELAEAEDNALSLIRNPYKGLQAFQTEDARDFFGRDSLIERMLARFREKRLVAIVGPSGSGKSSVLKAGLAPRLDGEGQPFLLAEMYPGSYPFEELEGALAAIAVSDAPMSDQLVSDERGLVRVLQTVLPTDNTELVLAIDQFEELFSMTSSEPIRALFLDSLVAAVSDPRSRLRVVLTLRADFFDRPLRYPGFGTLVEAGLVPVTMPDESGIAAVIEGPANAVGLTVEPGLIAQMVRDVSH